MFYLGIDVSNKSHKCLIIKDDGEKLSPAFLIENSSDGFKLLLEKLAKFSVPKENLIAGLEATGNSWENIFEFLTVSGFKVVLLNPFYTNRFREALRKKAKTDDIDALVIAQLLRTGEYGNCLVPDETVQTLRELVKLRYEFIKDLKNYKRQALSLLSLVFPEVRTTAIRNPFAVASMAILKQFPTAKHLAATSVKHLEKIVRHIKGNNFNCEELEKLIATAKNSCYSGKSHLARGENLKMILSLIESLAVNIKNLDAQIEDILSPKSPNDSFPGENLLSIDGVGKKTLAALLSAVGLDGKSFDNAKAIIGHIGFFPQIYQSGESRHDNRMSYQGPKYLRWHLYMAAVASIKHNSEMRTLYHKKVSQGKSSKQALICVAKKLAQMMLSMLKSGQPYNPARVFVNSGI
ncbi:MAG TPA: IS110 family transposase [Elusimicrobia bacterium]|nr:IS110 family transposase [Elusimicrobiota bacterium]